MDSDLEARLRAMLDKQDIYEVLMRYCRGVDRRDRDLIRSCFHPDAKDERRSREGPYRRERGDLEGAAVELPPEQRAPISPWERADRSAADPEPRQKASMHFFGNVLIEVEGDVGYSEAYCVGYLTIEPKDGVLDRPDVDLRGQVPAKAYYRELGFRYIDRFERRNGEWKIIHRITVDDWHRVDPVPDHPVPLLHGWHGLRSTNDPLYSFWWEGRGRPNGASEPQR